LNWSRRYTIKSYLLSTVWIAPIVALAIEQVTFRIAYAYQFDLGWFPGFAASSKEATIAIADYVISSSIAFIVFTFSSLIVAIQVASGQLTPRIIATTLLRDNAIRVSVAVFVYALLLAVAVKTRLDTIPRSLVSMTAILGLLSVLLFMFLIDHAARMLRPINIVWRIAQQGLQVIEDVYPDVLSVSGAPTQTATELGQAERIVLHEADSAIVIAVNLDALVKEAKKADAIIELVPRVGVLISPSRHCRQRLTYFGNSGAAQLKQLVACRDEIHTTDNAATCSLVCSSHPAAAGVHWSVRSGSCRCNWPAPSHR
jgi:uncharacterized membrane protein